MGFISFEKGKKGQRESRSFSTVSSSPTTTNEQSKGKRRPLASARRGPFFSSHPPQKCERRTHGVEELGERVFDGVRGVAAEERVSVRRKESVRGVTSNFLASAFLFFSQRDSIISFTLKISRLLLRESRRREVHAAGERSETAAFAAAAASSPPPPPLASSATPAGASSTPSSSSFSARPKTLTAASASLSS